MKLLSRPERLIEQEDFEAMSAYHEDSLQRHQRTTESKKQFRRRIRGMIKAERANGKNQSCADGGNSFITVTIISDPTYISAKEQRRRERQELRAMLKTEMVLEDKNKIDPDPVYEDEPE